MLYARNVLNMMTLKKHSIFIEVKVSLIGHTTLIAFYYKEEFVFFVNRSNLTINHVFQY